MERVSEIARKHGIRLMVQFGSSVSGRTHPRSDLDVGVLVERMPPTADAYGDLDADMGTLFPGRELDLAIINRADPLFLKKITDHCTLLFGSERELHRLKMYAFKRFQDHQPYLALERAYVARAIRRLAG